MTDAFTHFGLLLASVWSRPETSMVIRPAAQGSPGVMLHLGADTAGRRHILAPISDDYAFLPTHGDSLELKDWFHPETKQRFLDLQCDSDQSAKPFCVLADHVIDRVEIEDELPHDALLGALTEWRRLLKPAQQISRELARGLFGELTVLGMLATKNAVFAAEAWTGPGGDLHDFRTPRADLEVKASGSEGSTVTISSLHQLDRVDGIPLALIRVRVESSPAGQNLGDCVDRLVTLGCHRSTLIERLSWSGFRLGIDADDHRFVASDELRAWLVDSDFPGLRSHDIPEGRREAISRIHYTLDLLAAPGEMSTTDLDSYLERMMTE